MAEANTPPKPETLPGLENIVEEVEGSGTKPLLGQSQNPDDATYMPDTLIHAPDAEALKQTLGVVDSGDPNAKLVINAQRQADFDKTHINTHVPPAERAVNRNNPPKRLPEEK